MSKRINVISYNPPKSSVWGHSTRRLAPGEFRRRVAEFLSVATTQFETNQRILTIPGIHAGLDVQARNVVEQLHQEIGAPQDAAQDRQLSEEEFGVCLDVIAATPKTAMPVSLLLVQMHEVHCWNSPEPLKSVPAKSWLLEYYGSTQCLSTALVFSSIDEYRWVKGTISRTIGIELNDKHVRPKSAHGLL